MAAYIVYLVPAGTPKVRVNLTNFLFDNGNVYKFSGLFDTHRPKKLAIVRHFDLNFAKNVGQILFLKSDLNFVISLIITFCGFS